MGYAIACCTTTRDGVLHVEEAAAAIWSDVPAIVVERIADRLPRLLFGEIDVTIVAAARPRADLPEVRLMCTVPPDDVLGPWRQTVSRSIREFLTHLDADFAERGRLIRVELRRASGAPGCRAPWADPRRWRERSG